MFVKKMHREDNKSSSDQDDAGFDLARKEALESIGLVVPVTLRSAL